MPTECNFSVQVIVCQGLNALLTLLFGLSNSKWVCRSLLYLLCILSHAFLVYISLFQAILKLRISQMVAQLPCSCWPPTGKQLSFCSETSGCAKLEQNYARLRTAYLQSGNLLGAWWEDECDAWTIELATCNWDLFPRHVRKISVCVVSERPMMKGPLKIIRQNHRDNPDTSACL